MRFILFKTLTLATIIILLTITTNFFPYISNNSFAKGIENKGNNSIFLKSEINQELDLLYGKTILYLYALKDVSTFNVIFSVPPNYENQAPLLFSIRSETTANILNYGIYNDTNYPNKIINFTIGSINKKQTVIISFEYWVLIENKDYKDLPDYVEIPSDYKLPDDVKIWLQSTEAIQSDNHLIKLKANQLLKKSNNNLRAFADNIVYYTRLDKKFPFRGKYNPIRDIIDIGIATTLTHLFPRKFQRMQKIFYPIGNLKIVGINNGFKDALSVMMLGGGSCVGNANLGAALFRAVGIPSKQLILTPVFGKGENDYYWDHYICEYYYLNYGWVWAETTGAKTPYQPKNAIVLRVNYPEDENNAGKRLKGNGGIELQFWVPNDNIASYQKTWGWSEGNLTADKNLADDTFNLTRDAYELHTKYFGMNLNGENKQHYDNAILAQKNAINCFNQSDINGYVNNITTAYNEYSQISL